MAKGRLLGAMTKPEEEGVWGAGVQVCVYRDWVLSLPTASFLLCQLFNLHPIPRAIIHCTPDSVNEVTTLKSPTEGSGPQSKVAQ